MKPIVETRQLDYLYTQLEQLKTNMREKQSSLANVSRVGVCDNESSCLQMSLNTMEKIKI